MSPSVPREILLHGSPDVDAKSASVAGLQVMHLEMTDDILEELLETSRNGKGPKIQFGSHPVRDIKVNCIGPY
jgi:RNA polymerase II elongation factor ELL